MSNLAEAQRAAGGGDSGPRETGLVGVLRVIDSTLARVEEVVLSICLTALILVGVYGAVKRRFFPPSPFWVDEIVRYSVFFLGLCGAALAAQSERLFNIDMFTRMLGAKGKVIMRLATGAFTIYVCWMIFRGGFELRRILSDEQGELVRPSTGALAIPISMALIAAHMAIHMLIDVIYLATGRANPSDAAAAPKVH